MVRDEGGYDGFVAEFYDHVPPYADRRDLEFYRALAAAAGGPVLELGCGTGRVMLPMLRAGAEVCGIDSSRGMLAVCVEKIAREPETVRRRAHLLLADMRNFALGRRFALAVAPFRSFQHLLTVEDELACLACVRAHLNTGGRLVLDLFNPSLRFLIDPNREEVLDEEAPFRMPDGRQVRRGYRIVNRDFAEQCSEVELIYRVGYPGGGEDKLVHSFPMRWLYRFEAEHLLARAGFAVEAVYEDHAGTPFSGKDGGELLLVARRD
ncbi:class I SAM-dependent methyltransferase [bacterium]|nr:class I SAM-dependent methyltransferase [bacterium]